MKYKLFAALSATVFLFFSCYRQHESEKRAAYIDTLLLRNGDIIFREGRSAESAMVMALDRNKLFACRYAFKYKKWLESCARSSWRIRKQHRYCEI